jgi:hypothetical protein
MVEGLRPGATGGAGGPDGEWLDELTAQLDLLRERAQRLQEQAPAAQDEAKALRSLVAEARGAGNRASAARTRMRLGLGLD